MKKKKKNPNKIPLPRTDISARQSADEIAGDTVLLVWAEILGALADFPEMSQERVWELWKDINKTAAKAHLSTEVETWIRDVEGAAGIRLPYTKLEPVSITTQGEYNRYMRRVKRNARSCAYAIVAHPILEEELLPREDAGRLFQKAYGLGQELEDGRIHIADIFGVLEEELGLSLEDGESGIKLVRIQKEGG